MKSHSPGFSRKEVIVVVAIIGGLGFFYLVATRTPGPDPNRLRTARSRASRFAQAIEAYQALTNFLPVQTAYDVETDADGLYENCDIVRQVNGALAADPLLKVYKSELNAKGSFIDPWKHPYRVVMWKENPSDALCEYFQVYSCGPNEMWEQGKGDDITPGG